MVLRLTEPWVGCRRDERFLWPGSQMRKDCRRTSITIRKSCAAAFTREEAPLEAGPRAPDGWPNASEWIEFPCKGTLEPRAKDSVCFRLSRGERARGKPVLFSFALRDTWSHRWSRTCPLFDFFPFVPSDLLLLRISSSSVSPFFHTQISVW